MSDELLRIGITADPDLPVPPDHYGGIERVISMLVQGLTDRGHDVTLFARAGSRVPCTLVPYAGNSSRSLADTVSNMRLVASEARDRRLQVLHSFGRLAYLLPLLPRRLPKIMSYQRAVTARSISLGRSLSRGSLHFTACSRRLIAGLADRGSWHVIYNGVPTERYVFRGEVAPDSPLVFLGRIEHIKGPHVAIEVARRSGRRLVIAGNVAPEHDEYFNRFVAPHVDGHQVVYAGPVDDEQKNDLLGRAAALLMPILWEEPFGIVMAEALACGTPVLGFRRGSVPEVVDDSFTGFVCDTTDQMVDAVARLHAIDRARCRQAAVLRFSDAAIVAEYERLYRSLAETDERVSEATCTR